MYTLSELKSKTFGELKKIGYELNVLPKDDRRYRQSWIDALVNVNPPLLQLLEDSPAVSVEQVQGAIEVQAQEQPLESRSTQKAQEYKFFLSLKDGHTILWYDGKDFVCEKWSAKTYCKRGVGAAKHQLRSHPEVKRVFCSFGNVLQVVTNSPCVEPIEVQSQEQPLESKFGRIVYPQPTQKLIAQNEEARPHLDRAESADIHNCRSHPANSDTDSSGARTEAWGSQEGDRVLAVAGNRQTGRGRVLPDQPTELVAVKPPPGVEVDRAQELIAQAAKTPPGVDLDDELPECSNCFGEGYVEDEFGVVKFCPCETEPRLSHQRTQSAIASAAKNSLKPKSDLNPILTGIALSDRFLARYAPPQSGIVHFQSDADGQLSLLNFEIEFASESPDPDDFESLDAFREAIARWDREHPSSSDHCSDLPNSVHSEPPDPEDFDSMFAFWAAYDAWDEASDDDSEPLEVSIDSFCEWAPCPTDWYQPAALLDRAALLDPSKAMELSLVYKNSSTSDFFIPTFGRWGDRPNRSDEPPDTGIFARLPKPKPPTFPPQAANQTQVSPSQPKSAQVNQASRNYPETIPKLFHCIAAGSSTQPARSPPGGDAGF